MRKRQSHWPVLTYHHHPCLDFSESDRANADDLINIHEPSSSIILSALLVVEFVVVMLLVLFIVFDLFFFFLKQ